MSEGDVVITYGSGHSQRWKEAPGFIDFVRQEESKGKNVFIGEENNQETVLTLDQIEDYITNGSNEGMLTPEMVQRFAHVMHVTEQELINAYTMIKSPYSGILSYQKRIKELDEGTGEPEKFPNEKTKRAEAIVAASNRIAVRLPEFNSVVGQINAILDSKNEHVKTLIELAKRGQAKEIVIDSERKITYNPNTSVKNIRDAMEEFAHIREDLTKSTE